MKVLLATPVTAVDTIITVGEEKGMISSCSCSANAREINANTPSQIIQGCTSILIQGCTSMCIKCLDV